MVGVRPADEGVEMITFGERLKQLREAAGLSQPELAAKAGMHKFGIAKLERGDREPSWSSVVALTKALGVDCREFLPADGEAAVHSPAPVAEAAPSPAKRGRPRKAPAEQPAAEQPAKKAAEPVKRKGRPRKGE